MKVQKTFLTALLHFSTVQVWGMTHERIGTLVFPNRYHFFSSELLDQGMLKP